MNGDIVTNLVAITVLVTFGSTVVWAVMRSNVRAVAEDVVEKKVASTAKILQGELSVIGQAHADCQKNVTDKMENLDGEMKYIRQRVDEIFARLLDATRNSR